ncbi:FadR family transcriptional regulator [Sphingomonas sp. S1-29]|uniref:FadR/GntR family transcriptional regulator n=1 Tax=Sphingomonas sp. S1-29 TaxID=2991074 RepID=UPI00223F6D0B|nr:FadR/GntR family transcriptional regulator [Sphingomonas sp. S1-29]UZK70285.1 FadR family transcriptional regulator [Sphingomonas sp. S1-29]
MTGEAEETVGSQPQARRVRGAVAHELGRSILAGAYRPGEFLLGEVVFAEKLGVSRGVYREAVQVLTGKGLVESRRKLGTRVLPRNRWNMLDPDVLAWGLANNPDLHLLRSLFEIRAVIEPAAAAFAAERHDAADIERLRHALDSMGRLSVFNEEGRAADRDFHAAILTASRNDALITLSAGITAAVGWTSDLVSRGKATPRDPMPDHIAVYNAIADRDPTAAFQAMKDLVDFALADTRETLDGL